MIRLQLLKAWTVPCQLLSEAYRALVVKALKPLSKECWCTPQCIVPALLRAGRSCGQFRSQCLFSFSPYKSLIITKYLNLTAFSILFLTTAAEAKDLGVRGPVFAIEEENMASHILSHLQKMESSGELKKHQEAMAEKAKAKLQRPTAVSGVSEAKESKSWLFDPSITIQNDITDHKGQIIAKAGTAINPLDKVSFGKPLLLIDGDNEEHLKWATSEQDSLLVLVKGSPFELMENSDRRIFFDQAGSICRRFGIKHVPARVSQKGKALLIEEIALEEGR